MVNAFLFRVLSQQKLNRELKGNVVNNPSNAKPSCPGQNSNHDPASQFS